MDDNSTFLENRVTELPEPIAIAGVVLGSIIVTTGIFGNFVIIASLSINKKLRRRNNVFIGSLAIADLIFFIGLCTLFLHIYCQKEWSFGGALCMYVHIMVSSCVTCVILHILVITFYRYMLIVHPQHYGKLVKIWVICLVIFLLYFCSFGLVTLSQQKVFEKEIIYGKEVYFDFETFFCPPAGKSQSALPVAIIIAVISIILLFMYLGIYLKVRKSRKKIEMHASSPLSTPGKRQKVNNDKEVRVVKIMLVVYVVFVLTYIPWPVVFEVRKTHYVPLWLHLLVNLLLWLSSGLNWVIYGLMNRDFRDTYKSIVCCQAQQCTNLAATDSSSNQMRETPT